MPLRVYSYSYLIHVSSTITTKSFVSGNARKYFKTLLYHRLSLSFQLARMSLNQELSPNPA